MDDRIQQLLNQGGEIRIPSGEWEGPFSIHKPCVIMGNRATLWAKQGPVVRIESNQVILKQLRIEVTEAKEEDDFFFSIVSKGEAISYEDVEVYGRIQGVQGEEAQWQIPRVIKAGEFPASQKCEFLVEMTVPVEAKIESAIQDVKILPEKLIPGKNCIKIEINPLKNGCFLYGFFFLRSAFVRRICFTAAAREKAPSYQEGKLVFSVEEREKTKEVKEKPSAIFNPQSICLKRGQRIGLNGFDLEKIQIRMQYDSKPPEMEIDPYVFLLDEKDRAEQDDRLIFFGNPVSSDGSVVLKETGSISELTMNLKKTAPEIDRIAISYAIYGNRSGDYFSKVKNPVLFLFSGEVEQMRFYPEDLLFETTIVMAEFYRYKGEWKVKAVGAGYRDGLKRLCESYGLEIVE